MDIQQLKQRLIHTGRHFGPSLALAVLIGGLGLYSLHASHATTYSDAKEAESGVQSGNYAAGDPVGASGSASVKFGAASQAPTPTPPAACANGGNYLWSNLETCGWPGPGNTGAVVADCPGGVLMANGGANTRTIHVTTAGSIVSCQNITGCLSVDAPNVTVQNVKITCTSGKTGENANGTSVINVSDGASATIDHVEINGLSEVHACIWHQGTKLIVTAINCYGINDGIFSWADTSYSQTTGDNFTIKDSYLHDFTTKTANGHIDGYQTEGAGDRKSVV